MRHGDKINNLGRTVAHRRALLANMANALIQSKRINTTLAKAKALRRYMEPLITKAKDNTTHSRRVVFSYLQNKEAVKELFGPIATKIGDRPGGYLRVIKTSFRRGDGAELALIELVDFNEIYNPNAGKDNSKKKTRRGARKKTSVPAAPVAAAATTAAAAAVADEPAVEEVAEVVEEAVAAPEIVAEAVETVAEETPAAEEAAPETTEEGEEKEA